MKLKTAQLTHRAFFSIAEICRLPLDYGGCSKFLPRWYYNTEKRRCEQFSYGGCFGNSNRFLSKQECENACTYNDVCGLPKPVSLKLVSPASCCILFNLRPLKRLLRRKHLKAKPLSFDSLSATQNKEEKRVQNARMQ